MNIHYIQTIQFRRIYMIRTTKTISGVKTIWVRLPYLHDKGDELKEDVLGKYVV